ncbi:MAG TPA: twin-arginine translocation signal domain-containing protein, partial [Phycisphaerales bacterium]|nr:twin-arginine translocation signal domain-containing protein [Phycisphaerales bacterium]
MCTHDHHCGGCLSSEVSRRGFLAAAGVSAAALQMGLLEFTSTLVAAETRPKSKPRIRLLFIRPKDQAKYWMSWPGNDYNADERQADFTKRLRRIARKLEIQL